MHLASCMRLSVIATLTRVITNDQQMGGQDAGLSFLFLILETLSMVLGRRARLVVLVPSTLHSARLPRRRAAGSLESISHTFTAILF